MLLVPSLGSHCKNYGVIITIPCIVQIETASHHCNNEAVCFPDGLRNPRSSLLWSWVCTNFMVWGPSQ